VINVLSPGDRIDAARLVEIAITECDAFDVDDRSDAAAQASQSMDTACEWFEVEYDTGPGFISYHVYIAAYLELTKRVAAEIERVTEENRRYQEECERRSFAHEYESDRLTVRDLV
jgi:hypothetical protein